MKEKRNPRPGAGTPGQGNERERLLNHMLQHITFDGPVSSFLDHGAENGITSRHLRILTGLDSRKISDVVSEERKGEVPILSDTLNGYFLPASVGEVRLFVKSMLHRSDEVRAAALGVQQWLDSLL